MTTEKDSIRFILERRGIINNGKFDAVRFQKLVTEPWIRSKTIKYGFDKLNETVDQEVLDTVNDSFKPIVLTNEMIDTPVKESEFIETEAETKTETEEPVVEIQEPITVVEEPVVTEEAVETSTESVLLEEDLKEEVVETQSETVEEPAVEEVVVEEPVVEAVEEAVETVKKKTSKKK
jgi:hypothetical protein